MLLGSDDKEKNTEGNGEKLFGAESGPSDIGKGTLFDSSDNNIPNSEGNDGDLVSSPFMVSFKANDPVNSVSEVLKENAAPDIPKADVLDAVPPVDPTAGFDYEDDLKDFEFDSSVSAFKPLSGLAPAAAPEPAVKKDEPAPVSEAAKAAEPAKAPEPAFDLSDIKKPEPVRDPGNVVVPEPSPEPEIAPFVESKKAGDDLKPSAPEPFSVGDINPPDIDAPLYIDDDPDFKNFAASPDVSPFKAGNDLDFAASTGSNSTFSGPNTEDLPGKEEIKAEAASVKMPEPVKAAEKEEEPSNLKTYGSVSSGVGAFGRRKRGAAPEDDIKEKNDRKPPVPVSEDTSKAAVAGAAAAVAAAGISAEKKSSDIADSIPEAANEIKADMKPAAPRSKAADAAESASDKAGAPEAPKAPVQRAPVKRPSAQAAQRPGSETVSAFVPKGKTNAAPVPVKRTGAKPGSESRGQRLQPEEASPKTPGVNQATIQPVTTVKKSKKKKKEKKVKEAGRGGIIALIVVLLVVFILLWALENTDKISALFGGKDDTKVELTAEPSKGTKATDASKASKPTETDATTTTAEATTTTTEATTTTTEATTTTTEATTEATTTTTEATTEATTTTTEATTTTTEATTTTTEATTTTTETAATTTKSSTPAGAVFTLRYDVVNSAPTENGFKFDMALENYGNKDCKLSDSLKSLSITLSANADITSVTSDYYSFTKDPNNDNTYIGTPLSSVTIPAGETLNATVNVTTSEHVNSFRISRYFYDWNK